MNNVNVRLSSLNNILKCKLSMHRLTIEFQFKQCSSHLLLWDISRRWNILSNEEKSQAALNQKKKKEDLKTYIESDRVWSIPFAKICFAGYFFFISVSKTNCIIA